MKKLALVGSLTLAVLAVCAYAAVTSIKADWFTGNTISSVIWSGANLRGGTATQGNGELALFAPGGVNHDFVSGWVQETQAMADTDFDILTKVDASPPLQTGSTYYGAGMTIVQDASNLVWCYYTWSGFASAYVITCQSMVAGNTTTVGDFVVGSSPVAGSVLLEMARAGTTWTLSYSTDGVTFHSFTPFSRTMTAVSVGLMNNNYNATAAQTQPFTATFDYICNAIGHRCIPRGYSKLFRFPSYGSSGGGTGTGTGNNGQTGNGTTPIRSRPVIQAATLLADNGSQLVCASAHIMSPLYDSALSLQSWWTQLSQVGKFNCVRAMGYLGSWPNSSTVMDVPTLQTRMDKAVANAAATGMYLIVDNHSECCGSQNVANDQNFWTALAGRYANNTNVIYEIKNAPDQTSNSALTSYESTMYSFVRNLAPNTPLLTWSLAAPASVTGLNTLLGSAGINYQNAAVALQAYSSPGDTQLENVYISARTAFPVVNTETAANGSSGAPSCCGFENWMQNNGLSWVWLDSDGFMSAAGTQYGSGNTVPFTIALSTDGCTTSAGGPCGGGGTATPLQCYIGNQPTQGPYSNQGTVVHSKSAGATGNGVTDDRAALQTALNAVPTGGTFFWDPGTYKISGSLSPNANSNVAYIGAPGTVQVNINESGGNPVLSWGGSPINISVKGIIFDGGGIQVANTSPISGWAISGNVFQNLFLYSPNCLACTVGIFSAGGFSHSSIDHNTFKNIAGDQTTRHNCTFGGSAQTNYPECSTGSAMSFYGMDTTTIVYNWFDHMGGDAVRLCLENTFTTSGIVISHNLFSNVHRMGVETQGGGGCGSTPHAGPQGILTQTPILEDNVWQPAWDPFWNTFFFSWATPTQYYNFSTSTFCGSVGNGCVMIGSNNLTIRNNIAYTFGTGYGYIYEASSTAAQVYGNYCYGCTNPRYLFSASLNGVMHDNWNCTSATFGDEQGASAQWNETYVNNTTLASCPASLATVTLSGSTVGGGTISGTAALSGALTGNQLVGIGFFLDGSSNPLAVDASSPYMLSAPTTGISSGSHALKATATDLWCNAYGSNTQNVNVP